MNRITFLRVVLCSTLALNAAISAVAHADNNKLSLSVELPRMDVAEYHKPYVAVWLEDSSRKSTQVALWYDQDMKDDEGKKWLKDIRQWWRRIGRQAEQPFDGLTSATKGPGKHIISVDLNAEQLKTLPAGEYQLRIEASREVGGREVINVPIVLPVNASDYPLQAKGSTELGAVEVMLD
ncbi:DUF2271 domain-containing protein [Colwellia echini]|uniref:DUF2271 domain-containing protein n=1 Tax=Colwellia echini TaxID=1982103 RepID=A0ABY3MSV0_9GAMM|nr:DUF2271 domain-containing protein [Colwellia echini]TYK64273.1 DUF2271 domain-containing protein [Colwellia echini]